jgi:hypothetical protein
MTWEYITDVAVPSPIQVPDALEIVLVNLFRQEILTDYEFHMTDNEFAARGRTFIITISPKSHLLFLQYIC